MSAGRGSVSRGGGTVRKTLNPAAAPTLREIPRAANTDDPTGSRAKSMHSATEIVMERREAVVSVRGRMVALKLAHVDAMSDLEQEHATACAALEAAQKNFELAVRDLREFVGVDVRPG